MIQHKDIPNEQLHEPKGANSASDQTIYVADGLGSGVFRRLNTADIQNINVDLNSTNRFLSPDGQGNIIAIIRNIYGVMAITNNTTAFSVSAASDSTLNTNSDYIPFIGNGAPWDSENLFNIDFDLNKLIINQSGLYRIDFWADLTGFPSNAAKIAVKYLINGTTYSTRKVQAKSNSAGDSGNLNGFGLVNLNTNDTIQLAIASSVAGNVTFNSVNVTLSLVNTLQ